MREQIKSLLEEKGYLPIEGNSKWISISIDFIKGEIGDGKKAIPKKGGVYIFTCAASGQILYVGKSKEARERFLTHYGKLNKNVNTKDFDVNDEFFQAHQGKITYYFLEIQDGKERANIERILIYALEPLYYAWTSKILSERFRKY